MSEAELHVLKERMYQGKLNKARRGALMGVPPIGYIRLASGESAIDPDEQVQSTVRLIFDQFDRAITLHGLIRHLVEHRVLIPVRARSGPGRPPLSAPGLVLKGRLEAVVRSLDRVEEKRGSRRN
jgi:DNA invertase Pin-like site-specific DNA recombinase